MTQHTKLICKSVQYHSLIDEDMFFEWLQRIKTIAHITGKGDELYLYLKTKQIPDNDLRELIALFYRYKVDMVQLKIFLNDKNKKWFLGPPKAYWHKKVFGTV